MEYIYELIRRIFAKVLPESRFKKGLRGFLNRYYSHMAPLSKFISNVQPAEDGCILVTLSNGLKLYTEPDGGKRPNLIRASYDGKEVMRNEDMLECFGTFWRMLRAQYVDNDYQRYYALKEGDIVVDAGANIGTFTVRAARAVGPQGLVVAIEPHNANVAFIKRNMEANELTNIVIVEKGLWEKKDRLRLFLGSASGHHTVFHHHNVSSQAVEIEVDTLDNILAELGITRVDFIKMDIEGAEIEAWEGMRNTLKGGEVKLAIAAYHTREGREPTSRTIVPWLKRDGFRVRGDELIVYAAKKSALAGTPPESRLS